MKEEEQMMTMRHIECVSVVEGRVRSGGGSRKEAEQAASQHRLMCKLGVI